ncbi:permease [Psychromonas arctica]|uniref:Permease n=1 Tax=Psychromonas arctica TaxID=168275 RepID=A0ABU9HAP0_9GAMM
MLLILSILALFLGPVTYRLLQRQPGWLDLLDAFIFVSISGLVLFHILPELLYEGGLLVLVLTGLGLLTPSLIEKYFHKAANKAHNTTLFLGVLGLVLHASLDGTVLLANQSDHTEWLLALGVLLHRFPVGLTIWWLLRPQYGVVLPFIVLISMAAATLLGASYAELSMAQLDGQLLAWFQAFVMGSIMHVVLHRPYLQHHKKHQQGNTKEHKYAAGIGSFFGLVVLGFVLLPHWLGYIEHNHDHAVSNEHEAHESHLLVQEGVHDGVHLENLHEDEVHDEHEHEDIHHNQSIEKSEALHQQHNTALTLVNFGKLALYSAPMLLFAYLLSGLMHYFKPALNVLPAQGNKGHFKDAIKGVLYGLPLPICSPAASKMHQQLLSLGANQTFATAFLIATPIIGFDAILISIPLLGEQLVLLRIVFAVLFAAIIAWLLGRHFKNPISAVVAQSCQGGHPTSRFITAIKQGYQHQLDHTAPWVIFGWALAATLSATPAWAFFEQALWLQVLVMVLIAFPFALCATGMTPIIAVMLIAGLSPGAAIACLLIGPSISLDLLKQLKLQQGYFAAFAFAMVMLVTAFLIGLSLNEYIDAFPLPWLGELDADFSWWHFVSLAIILVLYFASLLRRGARAFIAELLPKSLLEHRHHHH